jgi:hypothetical protein
MIVKKGIAIVTLVLSFSFLNGQTLKNGENSEQGKYTGEYMMSVPRGQFKWLDKIFDSDGKKLGVWSSQFYLSYVIESVGFPFIIDPDYINGNPLYNPNATTREFRTPLNNSYNNIDMWEDMYSEPNYNIRRIYKGEISELLPVGGTYDPLALGQSAGKFLIYGNDWCMLSSADFNREDFPDLDPANPNNRIFYPHTA